MLEEVRENHKLGAIVKGLIADWEDDRSRPLPEGGHQLPATYMWNGHSNEGARRLRDRVCAALKSLNLDGNGDSDLSSQIEHLIADWEDDSSRPLPEGGHQLPATHMWNSDSNEGARRLRNKVCAALRKAISEA